MAKRSIAELGSLQRAVIEVVWKEGQASVSQVRERLGGKRKPAYTTVLTVLQKLERAGWLRHRVEGRAYVYLSAHTRRQAGIETLRRFVERVFRGDPVLLFEHLLEAEKLSSTDIAELRRMLDEHHRKGAQ
jgi:BlaI family transcriptional regulator, penicillinase repressor